MVDRNSMQETADAIVGKYRDPKMRKAMAAANEKINGGRAKATSFGGYGTYIEPRLTHNGGYANHGYLGGGLDTYSGAQFGMGVSIPGINPGLMYGSSLGYGFGTGTSSYGPWGLGGGNNFHSLSTNAQLNHQIIAACISAYDTYGIVRNIIDLFADFTTANLKIDHIDKSVREWYRAWFRKIGGRAFINKMATELYKTSNLFIWTQYAKLSPEQINAMRRGKAMRAIGGDIIITHENEVGEEEEVIIESSKTSAGLFKKSELLNVDDLEVEAQTVPWNYVLLNPLQMEKRGSKFAGEDYWVFLLSRRDVQDIERGKQTGDALKRRQQYQQDLNITESNLPAEFKGKLKDYNGGYGALYSKELKLDNARLFVLQGKKPDNRDWSIPMTYPALKLLSFKETLRQMEARAAQSVINSFTVFKLGNIEKGYSPNPEDFEKLADILQSPGQAINFIWNDAIEIESVEHKINNIFDLQKYESVDRDILATFGISEVIVNGRGGNYSNSFLSVSTTLEKIKFVQEKIEDWFHQQFKVINKAMSFKRLPTLSWGDTPLTDKAKMGQLVLNLFDRNIISAGAVQEYFKFDPDIEISRMVDEKDTFEREGIGVLEKVSPFRRLTDYLKQGYTTPALKKEIDLPEPSGPGPFNKKSDKETKKGTPGRPPGTNTPQSKKRDTAPTGQNTVGNLDVRKVYGMCAQNYVSHLDNQISLLLIKAKGLDSKRQFTNEDKKGINQTILKVLANLEIGEILDENNIFQKIESNNNNELVYLDNVYSDKYQQFTEKNGREPLKPENMQLLAESWAEYKTNQPKDL